ncbi:hypothetical protein SLS63_012468 [Diaporthe eres]|uniref:non-specific serine/threonine protein kinase n=1 Tax=Diaporthe eres TaxID=83184 RepID=A0ABR1NR91_DIAER
MIIMEYCSLGSLEKQRRARSFNEGEIMEIMTQAFSAVAYLHSNNITHRDIKPANILIRSREPLEIAVSDFGSSKLVQSPMETLIGTYYYMAPEVLLLGEPGDNSGRNGRYSNKSDIWSLGVTAVHITLGRLPMLKDQDDFDMRYPSAMSKSRDMFLASFRNRTFAHLVSEMLSWEPEARPTAAECFYRASLSSRDNGAGAWERSYDSAVGAAKMPAIAVAPASWGSTPGFSGLLEGRFDETDVHRNIPETGGPDDLWIDESEDFSGDESEADDSERSGETEGYNQASTYSS